MHFLSFIFLQLLIASRADNTGIIRDYFAFKNVTRVAGFSCGEITTDGEIVKTLNNAGIAASIKHIKSINNTARFLHTRYVNLGIFLDLQCPFVDEDIVNLFHETSTYHMFDHLHQWLIFGENINRIVQLMNDETFSIITDVAIAVSKNDDYVLYDVYNHCKHCGGLLNITTLGVWTKDNGLKITLCLNKFSRRWNYHKMNVKVAGIVSARPQNYSLDQYLREKNNIRTDHWSKFGYSILIHIADMFNVTLQLIELNYWAKNDSNGPLMSGLNRGIYDLGFFPSILTNERLDLADVMLQVWPVRTCFMFLTVPSLKMDINIIIRPFARNVWYMIFLLIVVITFVLWAILKVEKDVVDSDYGATVLIIFAALCQQGLPFFSNQFASRIAFLQAIIFGLLVYNCYSAAVVSSRLNTPLNKMNDSLYSLLRSKMRLAAYKNVYFDVLLRSPVDEVRCLKRHWETIPEAKRFFSMEEGIRRMMKSGFAYHADTNTAYPLIERMFSKQMICQLTEVHLLRPTSIGLWSAPHNQFQETTKIGLIRICTAGIARREQLRWGYRKPYCNRDKHYVSSMTIEETMPILLVLLFGIILSAVICFMENIVFHLLQTKPWRKKTFGNRLVVAENKAVKKQKCLCLNN